MTMRRAHLFIAGLGFFCGCQSVRPTSPPVNLDDRLSSIEKSRRAAIPRLEEPLVQPRRDLHLRPAESTNAVASLGTYAPEPPSDDREEPAHYWALSDAGIAAFQEEGADSELDGFWAEKERNFIRRPPLASFWQTVKRDVEYLPRDLWRDTKRVYANPVNLVILGSAFGGSMALAETGPDNTIENHFSPDLPFGRKRVHRHMSGEWRDAFGAAGNPGTHFGLAGLWYLIGQQTMDDKTYEVGKTLFSALAINGVTVLLGQSISSDAGPNGERGTFPSGHTSSSFVFASVMHEAYGHLVGIPLYALAGLVAHERLESGEHYLSDVVMGAVLGTLVGHSVASGRDPEFFGWKVVPWVSPNVGTGLAIVKTMP